MLIHPWDAPISDTEWRNWLAGHDFGQLAVNDPGNGAPHVVPTHFAVAGGTLLVHLGWPNKVWAAIEPRPTGCCLPSCPRWPIAGPAVYSAKRSALDLDEQDPAVDEPCRGSEGHGGG